jgi:hypothetical protein
VDIPPEKILLTIIKSFNMKKIYQCCFVFLFIFASCERQEEALDSSISNDQSANFDEILKSKVELNLNKDLLKVQTSNQDTDFQQRVAQINEQLGAQGVYIEKMEYLSADGAGNTVFFSDRGNKQLASHFVPNDPRSAIPGESIYYLIDGTQLETNSGFNTLDATNKVMNTWNEVTCSGGLELTFGGITGADVGYVSNLFGFGGSDGFFAGVIVHGGVLPVEFFDAISPNGGSSILGVTFTLTYTQDINNDGKGDVAVKEIYFNDNFDWQDRVATGSGYDFETVALHEVGHALSQAHFGKVFRTPSNGKFHFSPRALMNAGYTGVNRVVEKTDEAGHCSNWGNWPNE